MSNKTDLSFIMVRWILAIPNFESIMLPLLQCVKDGKEWPISDIDKILIPKFGLSEEEANQLKPSSSSETLFQNRLRWARFYLKKADLLSDPRRGYTMITKQGVILLESNPTKIDIGLLKRFPSFERFYYAKKVKQESISISKETQSPEDMIIGGITEIRGGLESEILEKIKSCPPNFFEKIVVQLLERMGYGDGTPTGKSGDGGIDGMIKQDKLGLDEIYVQAKRWTNTAVPGKEVRDFAGALSGKKSKKGVFITTSNFSNEAIEFVKTVDSKIVLIDGEELAKLMFDYNIGFEPGDVYQLKKMDEDFFSE